MTRMLISSHRALDRFMQRNKRWLFPKNITNPIKGTGSFEVFAEGKSVSYCRLLVCGGGFFSLFPFFSFFLPAAFSLPCSMRYAAARLCRLAACGCASENDGLCHRHGACVLENYCADCLELWPTRQQLQKAGLCLAGTSCVFF